jgi:glycosyltransferase involved in cell wall biosynthesis
LPILRPLRRLEERRVRRWESHALRAYPVVVFITDEDDAAVARLDPTLHTVVIPNGVDTEFFAPDPAVTPDPGRLVFTGALGYPPNISAAMKLAKDVLPLVRARDPRAHAAIVGRGPVAAVVRLGDLDGVEIIPDVPDIRTWLRRASVFASTMVSGTGIKNKLLEALACGVPAVATTLSCQGMDVRDGEHLLIADGDAAFADAAARLLADDELRARLGAAGRDYVIEHHSWVAVAHAYEDAYADAIARRGAAPIA